jgi:hypothetical protein
MWCVNINKWIFLRKLLELFSETVPEVTGPKHKPSGMSYACGGEPAAPAVQILDPPEGGTPNGLTGECRCAIKGVVGNITLSLEVRIMRSHTSLAVTLFVSVTVLVLLAGPVSAQQSGRGGLSGDWNVKMEFNGRQMDSILSFSRDQDGNLTGQWISFMGVNALKDIKFE